MKGKGLIVVAVLLGVVVVFLVNQRLGSLEKKANPKLATFYQASSDIAPGTPLRSLLTGKSPRVKKVTSVPVSFAREFPDAIDNSELKWAMGKTIHRTIRAGEFLRISHLSPLTDTEVRARLPEGTVALAISVSQDTSVGYLVGPGDKVDVYLVTTKQDANAPGGVKATSQKVGADVEVFAVDNVIRRSDGTVTRPRGSSYRSVTLAAAPAQIERLMEARELGRLTLVLRGRAPR